MFKRKSRKISKYKTEESDYSPRTTTLKLKRNPGLHMQTPFHHHNHARHLAWRGHLESRVTQGYTIDIKGKKIYARKIAATAAAPAKPKELETALAAPVKVGGEGVALRGRLEAAY